jgi:hypothetical protein
MSKKKPSKKPVPVPPPVPASPEAAVDQELSVSLAALDGLNLRVWHLEQQVAALRKPWSIWSLFKG